ncbi:MAG: family 20 glycosylhydrolase, partial [Acidobacteriota bacterium]|nr:family 20 glycosylhydrolase [Acidobacteriota bacterium]
AFYAEQTLGQLADERGGLPVGTVEDWPDLAVRGVMLDVSRTKVPTLETLFALVDRLASWKVNQVQLYMEHTFAYPGHEEVWRAADPYDAADLTALADHCAARHVELVANQNCLGHMERWLLHDRYAPLGIARGVVRGPMGMALPPSTIDPANPASFGLVEELLDTLTGVLPGGRLHVGLDEPWDLPTNRYAEWGEWARRLRSLPATAGRDLLVWGDMLAAHPDLLRGLPEGVTVCEWGYEANHPFGPRLEAIAEAGLPRWVSPGTSSWLSVVGRVTNAVDNCRAAAGAAAGHGAEGLLVTDWGDMGHLQHLPVSDPGLAAAAAFGWCLSSNAGLGPAELAPLLDRHCYGDPSGALGEAVVALGDLHTLQPLEVPNISALVLHLYFPQLPVGPAMGSDVSSVHLEAVEAARDGAGETLRRARPTTDHGRLAVEDLLASAELVRLCLADAGARLEGDGTLLSVPTPVRAALADRLGGVVEAHRHRWLARNRPGGLDESCAWLDHLGRSYRDGAAALDWAGPLVEAVRARDRDRAS